MDARVSPLNELHFGSLGGDGITMEPAMKLALEANFGSFEGWRDAFVASARAHRSGWMLLEFDPQKGTLANQWTGDEVRSGGVSILALDMREQMDAFMANIDWAVVYLRYQTAVHEASEPYVADIDSLLGAVVLDVRRAGVFEQADSLIPGAKWRDPKAVGEWVHDLPSGRPVVVYCVYGHEVGRSTAMRLRAAGVDARFLGGGIDGWLTARRPVVAKQRG
ncbi:rhodanese-like domain-containing protein [Variovorax sp. YR216]|uniref:rhodanese-like domain-containing protein n=1 Tax=Variovorax sp. YR216 TaxID=1882828 RepID=UPI00089C9711|nr:rhodanese-like domain-containing protein [Variovorax sp. YR216]SDZ96629.1 superoxide dismutase, Fe-Mn family [Variovorax sp. YR216]